MSSPPPPSTTPNKSDCVKREDWDRCIRSGTWRVAIGILVGAVGSTFLVSEVPMMVGAGVGIGWAVRHCKRLLNKDSSKKEGIGGKKTIDPCLCCRSDFEALDKHEFDVKPQPAAAPPPSTKTATGTPPPPKATPPPPKPTPPPPPKPTPPEEQCTCNTIPTTWTTPKPEDPPPECSCYR